MKHRLAVGVAGSMLSLQAGEKRVSKASTQVVGVDQMRTRQSKQILVRDDYLTNVGYRSNQ